MDLKFIDRVIRVTLLLAVLSFPFLALYVRTSYALSVLFGAVWGTLNLLAIKIIITSLLPGPTRKIILGLAVLFLKVPILYFAGYLLITWDYMSIYGLLWGFSGIFIVILFKVLGRLYLGLDNFRSFTGRPPSPKETET